MIFTDHSVPNPDGEVAKRANARAAVFLSPSTGGGLDALAWATQKNTLSKFPKLHDVYGAFVALSEADMVGQKNGLSLFSDAVDQQATVRAMSANAGLLINDISGDIVSGDPVYGDFLKAFTQQCQDLEKRIGIDGKRGDVVGDLIDLFRNIVRGRIIGAENFTFDRLHTNEMISNGVMGADESSDREYGEYLMKLKSLNIR